MKDVAMPLCVSSGWMAGGWVVGWFEVCCNGGIQEDSQIR